MKEKLTVSCEAVSYTHLDVYKRQVVDILSIPLIGVVPDDENVVIATNQGEPLVGNHTLAGRAYRNICQRILGQETPYLLPEPTFSFWTKVTGIFHKSQEGRV